MKRKVISLFFILAISVMCIGCNTHKEVSKGNVIEDADTADDSIIVDSNTANKVMK